MNRPVLTQRIQTLTWAIGTVPTPILSSFNPGAELVGTLVVTVPSTAANNVFLGDGNVTAATGMELVAGGGPIAFELDDDRPIYELQDPAMRIATTLQCQQQEIVAIPLIVWDLSQIYGIAAANTNVSVAIFRKQWA